MVTIQALNIVDAIMIDRISAFVVSQAFTIPVDELLKRYCTPGNPRPTLRLLPNSDLLSSN